MIWRAVSILCSVGGPCRFGPAKTPELKQAFQGLGGRKSR